MQNKVLRKKLVLKQKVKILFSKILITIIVIQGVMICLKMNIFSKDIIIKNVYENSIHFMKIRNFYGKYFSSNHKPSNLINTNSPVFNEKINYKNRNTYKDGVCLTVDSKYMVPSLESGIVVFIGNKDGYGRSIIVEQVDGVDVYYCNVINDNLKLYDYVSKGEYVGQAITNKLYLIFQKDGKILDYKNFL